MIPGPDSMDFLKLDNVVKKFGDTPVINGVSLAAREGEFVVFVGPSGCGKSTLLRLVAGLDEVSGGRIHIDGKDVTEIEPASRSVSMVFQSYALYPHMTVRKNMSFGLKMIKTPQPEIDRLVNEAAGILKLEQLLERRPKELSGGQRQRIAIARVVLKDAPILILDEATSALDNESEALVQEALELLMVGRTTFVIAHRLSTVRGADRILVLEAGKIVEQGTHETLIAQGGLYKDLYELQFRRDRPQRA